MNDRPAAPAPIERDFSREFIDRTTWRLIHLAERLEKDTSPKVRKLAGELREIWNDKGPPVQ